jgi:hypothetical protein
VRSERVRTAEFGTSFGTRFVRLVRRGLVRFSSSLAAASSGGSTLPCWMDGRSRVSSAGGVTVTVLGADAARFGCRSTAAGARPRAVAVAIPWPRDSATNADERAIAVRPKRAPDQRPPRLPLAETEQASRLVLHAALTGNSRLPATENATDNERRSVPRLSRTPRVCSTPGGITSTSWVLSCRRSRAPARPDDACVARAVAPHQTAAG